MSATHSHRHPLPPVLIRAVAMMAMAMILGGCAGSGTPPTNDDTGMGGMGGGGGYFSGE